MPTKKKEKAPPGPDDLVRESAGLYKTGDGRFEVQKTDLGWYLVDTAQANEFGQQLIHGPLQTLGAVREAIPGARDIKPLLRVRPKKQKADSGAQPPAPPPSWIDQLPEKEAAQVRSLVRALDKEGVSDAEGLVRRHRDDVAPLIATRVVEHRLQSLVEAEPEDARAHAADVVRRVVDVLADAGTSVQRPLPGWALVEVRAGEGLPLARMRPKI